MSYLRDKWDGAQIVCDGITYACHVPSDSIIASEGFVPNSPSPDYPSPINSVNDFDLVSKTPNILNNGNFANGITGWTASTGSLSVNNKILKLTASSIAAIVIRSNTNEPCVVGNKYFLRARVRRLDNDSSIDIRLRGTTSGTYSVVAKQISSVVVGEWQYIYGIATVTSELTGNVRFIIYINNIDNGQVEVDGNYGVMLIPMGKDASHSLFLKTENEMNILFPNYIDKNENEINFPYTLRSLPDGTKDYIEIDNINKTTKLVRSIGERVFTGYEPIGSLIDFTNTVRFEMAILTGGLHGLTNKISTHFPTIGTSADETEHIRGTVNVGLGQLIIFWINKTRLTGYSSELTDTEKRNLFKSWLTSQYNAGTPVTVQYELATPTIEDLNYNEVTTYYPYTNIYTTATIQPMLDGKIRIIDRGE